MRVVAISSVVFAGVIGAAWLLLRAPFFSDDFCLRVASTEVLGNSLYGQSCPRSAYVREVEKLAPANKAAALFRFHPAKGWEARCPPIDVVVDRESGEAWLLDDIHSRHEKALHDG